jgi:hypothetical protein
MPVECVALIPRCAECEAAGRPPTRSAGVPYLACDDLDEQPEVVFYCRECAEREFCA